VKFSRSALQQAAKVYSDKVKELEAVINETVYERDEIVHVGICCVLTRMNMFQLGSNKQNWGVAKTYTNEKILQGFGFDPQKPEYFTTTLNSQTLIDSIVGMPWPRMDTEELIRRPAGIRVATVAHIGEIWNASGPILTCLNDLLLKEFKDGTLAVEELSQLRCIFSDSNVLPPLNDSSLWALKDRFHFNFVVGDLTVEENFKKMLRNKAKKTFGKQKISAVLSPDYFEVIEQQIGLVEFPESAITCLSQIRNDLIAAKISLSPRRYNDSIAALKYQAWYAGDTAVRPRHFGILKPILWELEGQRVYAEAAIEKVINSKLYAGERRDQIKADLAELNVRVGAVLSTALNDTGVKALFSILEELKPMEEDLDTLAMDLPRSKYRPLDQARVLLKRRINTALIAADGRKDHP